MLSLKNWLAPSHAWVPRSGAEAAPAHVFNYILKVFYLGCEWKELVTRLIDLRTTGIPRVSDLDEQSDRGLATVGDT